ncbi:MAG: hypothetical protein RR490_08850 [Niameybacter sp.]
MANEIKTDTINGQPYKEWVYQKGVWNDKFVKVVAGNVTFEGNRIKLAQNSQIDILSGYLPDRAIYMEFIGTLASGVAVGATCYMAILDSGDVAKGVNYNLISNAESVGMVKSMGINYFGNYGKLRIKCEASQLIYISKIWIESVL